MDTALQNRIERIADLVDELKHLPDPALREKTLQLVQTLMDFHGAALDRLMELVAGSGETGWRVIDMFERDELVSNMLLLHGMHPVEIDTRVRRALEKVRPTLQAHGGNVELMEI